MLNLKIMDTKIVRNTKIVLILIISIMFTFNFAGKYKAGITESVKTKSYQWGDQLTGNYVGKSEIESEITGITYPYHIYLPASYEQNADKKYAIIYSLDAQWSFRAFAKFIDRDNRDVILVAIEEGPNNSKRREIDYRMPGVNDYFDFFRQEFMPVIESK